MKKYILFAAFLSASGMSAFSQYYYKDILSNKQLVEEMALYKKNKVRSIHLKSFEDDESPSKGFFCKRSFSKDYLKSELGTRSGISTASLFTSQFNENGSLQSTHDSSDRSVTHASYSYDNNGRIASIKTYMKSMDDDFVTDLSESHIYFYDPSGNLEKMVKIVNKKDSTMILFAKDDHGNISIEKNTKSGTNFYYYYNSDNRLTDIARDNEYAGRALPDYLFEYNELGQLTQMMSTEEGSSNYFIWNYSYNDKGLRNEEKIYTKERRLMGSIQYEYK